MLEKIKSNSLSIGILWVRITAGSFMAYHGFGKVFGGWMPKFIEGVAALGFPLPGLFAWAAALSEFVGGVCLVLGLGTRIAGLMVFFTMAVAAFMQHASDPFQKKELALLYLAIFGAFTFIGGGCWSMDSLLRKKFCKNAETKK